MARPQVDEAEVRAVREVLLSGNYVAGEVVRQFEQAFADYIGVRHAVAVSSGTAALHIALQAMGIGRGDEVIVPPVTFFATVSAVLYVGAVPIFADIDSDDLCLSPDDTHRKISARTRAVLPVHLHGAAAKMDRFKQLAEDHDLLLLEDCAQAHGTAFGGARVGGIGHAGAFSFFATKHLTPGEGGMITTDDAALAAAARTLGNHGLRGRDDHVVLGYNNRMTEIAAAMGLVQLAKLEDMNARRIRHSERIIAALARLSWARVPHPLGPVTHTYFWCPLMVTPESGKTIEQLKAHLDTSAIGYRHRYSEPLYRQPVLRELGFDYSGLHLPVAESVAGKVIGLPNHPGLSEAEVDRVIEVVNAFA